jgi:phosphoribosylformylglycinamidine cyclo-ligase
VGNTSRVIPQGLRLSIDWQSWTRPAIFQVIQKHGTVPEEDMRKTFNLGIGLVIVAAKRGTDRLLTTLRQIEERPIIIGEVVKQ